MLVIDSLSTAAKKGRSRRTSATSASLFSRLPQSRRGRVAAFSIAAAAILAPTAAAATTAAHRHSAGKKSTVQAAVLPAPPPPPPAPPKHFVPTIGVLTSTFGERWGELHGGVDIAAPIGTPIVAVTDGFVIEAGPASGYGQWVRVQQADGTTAVFGHVDQFFVTAGQPIKAGEVIATVGNLGQSTGPHLHYEVWLPDGTKIDPLPWLLALGLNLGPLQV